MNDAWAGENGAWDKASCWLICILLFPGLQSSRALGISVQEAFQRLLSKGRPAKSKVDFMAGFSKAA
jgi:hypothetical protein